MSGPLLQEGFICMIMAAPIFYIVGALAAWPFDHYRKKQESEQDADASKLNMLVLPALLLIMSMEGVTDYTTFNRSNIIERTETVNGTISEIKSRLSEKRVLPAPDSLFAKLFPRTDVVNAQGLSMGDKHWIDVSYFKWIYWNEKKGSTYFKVIENKPSYVRFIPGSDTSYFNSYLDWGDTEVFFEQISGNRTRVTWKINFIRKLDPAWYVQPLQRFAVGVLAETMIASLK